MKQKQQTEKEGSAMMTDDRAREAFEARLGNPFVYGDEEAFAAGFHARDAEVEALEGQNADLVRKNHSLAEGMPEAIKALEPFARMAAHPEGECNHHGCCLRRRARRALSLLTGGADDEP